MGELSLSRTGERNTLGVWDGESQVGYADGITSAIREIQDVRSAIFGRSTFGTPSSASIINNVRNGSIRRRYDQIDYQRRGGQVSEGRIT